ncbi:CDP-alcohol phosphatidyltransferase-domain-containing protein [Halteromyces radiatus]|uniref:CDP-alcohol phosphatidyltransferase-domain-containing protein n=1 Tax=Halteromyces radiatus TaxID=101107 RepID=UPI00221EFBA3|nr:CDP-alcohol phosphatidyltransferase-domain-containing protein [Halteromyces radiatus]KAI8089769.1 CDP-alcohol phosphatidyltransferase-domain-containing protein [Halteromyces radiatus]
MPSLFSPEFLTQEQLENLKLYKYAAIDRSFTTKYILRHYWNAAIELFPMWMAPNLITLIGLLFMIINVIFAIIFIPDMDGEEPSWIYFSFALGVWLYSTFDNVDGKQARRTGTSSPLGELFDHGCDALNCSFAAVLQAAGIGLGHSYAAVILYSIAMLGFYLSTAEEYHTGVLYLGYVNAPTEGVILSCILFIISGLYGPSVYNLPVSYYLPQLKTYLPSMMTSLSVSHALIAFIAFMAIFTHLPVCFYAMYKACRKNNKPFVRTMLIQNMPIAVYSIAFISWVSSPYSTILSHHHFILYAITTGIVFGRIASKIILAHLTKSRFPRFTVLLVPLIIGAIITNLPRLNAIDPIFTPESEYLFICGYFVFAVLAYLRWAVVVINSFCSYLGINCLTIPKRKTM